MASASARWRSWLVLGESESELRGAHRVIGTIAASPMSNRAPCAGAELKSNRPSEPQKTGTGSAHCCCSSKAVASVRLPSDGSWQHEIPLLDTPARLPETYTLTIAGATLRRGFWLYVWDAAAPSGDRLLYVGRTGDNSEVVP